MAELKYQVIFSICIIQHLKKKLICCNRLLVHHVTSYTSHCQTTGVQWNTPVTFHGQTHPVDLGLRGRQRQALFSAIRRKSPSDNHGYTMCMIVSCVSDFSQQRARTCLLCCILLRQNHTRLTFSTFSPLTTQILITGVISSHISSSSFPCSGLNFTILHLKVTCKCDCMWPILQFPHL